MKNELYRYVIYVMAALMPYPLSATFAAVETAAVMQERKVTGRITDANEAGLIGATVKVKGTSIGTVTDLNGHFTLTVPNENAILEISAVGYAPREVPVKGKAEIRLAMVESTDDLEEVVVTAYGTQKKESMVSAITTVKPSDLKIPASNLTQAFAGRIAGVIAYQRSGEPGLDNAEFYIRGVTSFSTSGKRDPLILIDGVEMNSNDLARMNVDDISSFSVMKDAAAAALYGARGANGVILVTTKEGKVDRLTISIRGEQSNSYNTKMLDLADPVTYMKLHNEAVRTRDPMQELPYSSSKIRGTELGLDPIRYPAVNWYDYLIDDHATNRRLNLNLTGGGQSVQYYLAANYQNDQGILKESKDNMLDNNINIDRLQVRSNVTIKFAPTTTGIVRAYGSFDDRTGPYIPNMVDEYGRTVSGGAAVFRQARNATQVQFLPSYPADEATQFNEHILFGRDQENSFNNPWANLVSSYQSYHESMMQVQLEMDHKFIGKLEGLTARGIYNAQRRGTFAHNRAYFPFYYALANTIDGSYRLMALNPDQGTEYLNYGGSNRLVDATQYGEVRLQYNKLIKDKHDINVLMVGTIRNATTTTVDGRLADDVQGSLPSRNLSNAMRIAYGYDSRYNIEFNYGLNGTERFAENNRWGFFPTVGAGWNVSNEKFWSGLKETIPTLRIRATYGEVGNDQIGALWDRFFYLSQINMNAAATYPFGMPGVPLRTRPGITINRYANEQITWEIARKANFGFELGLFNDLTVQTDIFHERRRNILQTRQDIPTTMGIRGTPQANVGISEGSGFETELKYNKTLPNGLSFLINGNFTYATARFVQYEEPNYDDVPWRSRIGLKIKQQYGLIAERFFVDEEERNNSPVQQFGEYLAGDLKYKDINGDGRITADDIVPIGYPEDPEIIYGSSFTVMYKAFDVNFFIQGSGRSSFFVEPLALQPFVGRGQKALVQMIADDHWSESNRDVYAFWPRLSEYNISNNFQRSTWWLRDGTFVRLKQVEVGYTLPENMTKRAYVSNMRVYLSGTNLAYWSKFKLWDPEMAGLGLGYPLQRVFNLGVSINL